ncbi:hypothetical protein [Acinetobacter sp. YH12144]|uniref:hypothetical protein n=1 Tax=Acinetobacter sp. YH12144 TaxID=2601128 RepID=UPI0015D2464D|nr:hypothetical protein [Acinetobacter sp. YH12144]
MVASTDTKFYVYTNTGAPELNNQFGCMLSVLDACLINGFGSQTVSTLTASGTTVTATFGSAHNFMQYQVIKIAGANQTEFNGEHRILTVPNTNTITFQLAAAPSVTTATGTISASLPALGWEKPFSSTHASGTGGKAAYRSSNTLLASRPFLRVVDELDPAYNQSYAKYAKVGIVEDMTGIDTMLGAQAPFDVNAPDKNWVATGSSTSVINGWAKWYYAMGGNENSSTNETTPAPSGKREWVIVGNDSYFYLFARFHTSNSYTGRMFPYFFGPLDADYSQTSAIIALHNNKQASDSVLPYGLSALSVEGVDKQISLLSDYKKQSKSVFAKTLPPRSVVRTGYSNYFKPPDADVPVFSFRLPIIESDSNVPRGNMPGVYWLGQATPYGNLLAFLDGSEIKLPIYCMAYELGQMLFDIGDSV